MSGPRLAPGLQLRQTQSLVMTPQLQQAIRLLQLSNLELAEAVAEEIERNPLLREAPDAPAGEAPAPPPAESPAERALDRLDLDPSGAEAAFDAPFDPGADGLAEGAPEARGASREGAGVSPADPAGALGGPGGSRSGGGEAPDLAEVLADRPSLLTHLEDQLRLMRAPAPVAALARLLAAEVDDAGYLRADPLDLAARVGAPGLAAPALALLHACEPAGIGARDLAECLALQIAEADGAVSAPMAALLANLPLLARADFRALADRCGVAEEEVRALAARIRRCDPRPGRAFTAPPALAVAPEILVTRGRDGWDVALNEDTLPRVLVDRGYARRLGARDPAARAWLAEARRDAAWMVRSLESRARTMLKVAAEVVRRQEGFFETGVAALRPMTLRDVAEAVDLHESTVSRATAGKHLSCPAGTLPLRFFFTQALQASDGGDAVSSAAVQARIRALVDGEDPLRTLSDDALAARLKSEGVDVARRTIAKYREGMNIPSSVQRRRLKAARRAPA